MSGNHYVGVGNTVRRMKQLGRGSEFDQNISLFSPFGGLLGIIAERIPNPA